jgi:hypothetical protein
MATLEENPKVPICIPPPETFRSTLHFDGSGFCFLIIHLFDLIVILIAILVSLIDLP